MRPQRSYSWMKAWCVRLSTVALVVAIGGAASAQDIDLNPVQGAAPDIKQEEPNAKTVTELETSSPDGEEEINAESVDMLDSGEEAAAQEGDKKKDKKAKKEKKERKKKKGDT